ncbi:ABC transporter ATP-binding protein [Oceanirhabdus sp. W0125-5]|uniref:ABC transporter ATP-binding protein n=1 Tax=Oceanirhabdus sp. W0125-5 TaxID=2999116 RepID=UPI0022F2C5A6|nr:ABC transporter ATP-binding protein [Oceanirhabdus sp. W0125-5]WBW96873.1 ABC transporter ATP-binding protein [Oceanirhabdus sp. W0125-5]
MEILTAKELSKIYTGRTKTSSTTALCSISLSVFSGEFISIMGPSGSGKTTLLNILSGMLPPDCGSVILDGIEITSLSTESLPAFRREKIGFVFQDFNLIDSLTVEENIQVPLVLNGESKEFIIQKTDEIVSLMSFKDLINKYPDELSGGQKQRVAIGRAMIGDPNILFCDEPTGNLDSKSTEIIMDILTKLNKENKKTILLVTHDPFTASYSDKVIFLKDGSINSYLINCGDRKNFYNNILSSLEVI